MKRTAVICLTLCVLFVCAAAAYASLSRSEANKAGQAYQDAVFSEQAQLHSSEVVAEYGSHKITKGTIAYYRTMRSLGYGASGGEGETSDRELADRLIRSIILEEEAVRLGLAATDAEVEAMYQAVLQSYEIPDGKALIDDYCEGAGITVQEYFDLVRQQLPETITRQKLKDEYGKIYCEEHGIEFTKVNQPQAMKDYVDQRLDDLFEEHRSEIVYHQSAYETQ